MVTLSEVHQPWMHNVDMESQSLEKRHGVLSFHLLEHNSELVIGDLVNEVTLELHLHVVATEHGAERVALRSEEAEAVAFKDGWVVKAGLHGRLRAHNREIKHVFHALVVNLYGEGECFCVRVDRSEANLLKFNPRLEFLNSFLDDGVALIKYVNDKLRCV